MSKQQASAKKPARAGKKKQGSGDRLAQIVALLATIMAAAYVVIRIINWIRFI